MKNGDIIGERDIDSIEIYAKELQPDMILDTETLVGMTPRRVMAPGKPVRGIDIITPELVSRGDNVTLVFDSAPLFLTAKGKALQNGGKGDMVRVVNVASNRTIEGTVTADGTVVVTP
jgi:flagella basal body P-ring formation protein FlgA